MSIFFSPDEPKEIDKHSGKVTRTKTRSTFSHAKDNTLTSKTRKIKIVPELHELKKIRASFDNFVSLFTAFNTLNGQQITGIKLAVSFQLFKNAFDSFLLHCSQYFNSSQQTRRVGRYSPLIEFSTQLLKEWSTIIITINKLEASIPIPHLKLIQENFDTLTSNISQIANPIVNRTYYKDCVYSSSNQLKVEITRVYKLIFTALARSDAEDDEISLIDKEKERNMLRDEMVILNRNINENFIGLIPSNISNTPECLRVRSNLKAACGDIISLVEAGFVFRKDVVNLLNSMKSLDNATRAMLDTLGIKYRLDVMPNGVDLSSVNAEEEEEENIDGKIEVVEDKPYFVEIPEPKKPRYTSRLEKKPYRGLSALKKIPEDQPKRLSRSQLMRPETCEERRKREFSKTAPNKQLNEFITSMSKTLGLEINAKKPEEEQMRAIERAIKEKMKTTGQQPEEKKEKGK